MKKNKHRPDSDVIPVEKYRNEIIPEDFPEGPYRSPYEPPLGKSTPWQDGQQAISGFAYENKNLHQHLPRQYPETHPTHDDKNKNKDNPF
ncbi:hypothetical protein SAMN05421736_12057 [Evansella caseinilytica]|uniref:Cytosolic protein n=1 Tax=Evansella caseinilytica TaxID=1503961 RepID=A0A1H3UDB5_9BACI|nr:hypothetical protein [Evansella caseinilytica]SDZ60277.1 hypothetical protein SAMN05421736_12057 [Evansella caseinilytica]